MSIFNKIHGDALKKLVTDIHNSVDISVLSPDYLCHVKISIVEPKKRMTTTSYITIFGDNKKQLIDYIKLDSYKQHYYFLDHIDASNLITDHHKEKLMKGDQIILKNNTEDKKVKLFLNIESTHIYKSRWDFLIVNNIFNEDQVLASSFTEEEKKAAKVIERFIYDICNNPKYEMVKNKISSSL